MDESRNPGILTRFLPTFLLFLVSLLALVFSALTLKISLGETRIRTLERARKEGSGE